MNSPAGRLHALLRLEHGLLEAAFVALVAMNTVNVFARYVFNHSIGSLFEIMVLLSVATYWLGIATAERTRSHLGMNFITSRLPPVARRIAEWLRLAIIAAFLLAAAFSAGALAISQYRSGAMSGTAGMALWPFTAFIPLGCLLMLLRALSPAASAGPGLPAADPLAQRGAP